MQTAEGFALKTFPYAEAHRICVFFTRQQGTVKAVAHGSRSLKSKFGSGLELFSEVKLSYKEREDRELGQLVTCDVVRSRFDAASNPSTQAMLSCWAELVIEFFPPHQANDAVFRLLSASLDCLERPFQSDSLFHYVETWLLKLAGFFPDLRTCPTCGNAFAPDSDIRIAHDGTPECVFCGSAGGATLTTEARFVIGKLLRTAPGEFCTLELATSARSSLAEVNQRLIGAILERPLKSYSIWRQLRMEPHGF
jgi:DNA repair protein RecO (recombination protein O)